MIRINLLPVKVRKTKGVQRMYTYLILGMSVAGVLLVLLLLNLVAQTRRADAKIARVEAASAKLADKIEYLSFLTAQEKKSERIRKLLTGLLPEQGTWIDILDQLAELVRQDVWLNRLSSQKSKTAAQPTLLLEGDAYSKISVADFMDALENSGRFTQVQLLALKDVTADNTTLVRFRLKFQYLRRGAEAEKKL